MTTMLISKTTTVALLASTALYAIQTAEAAQEAPESFESFIIKARYDGGDELKCCLQNEEFFSELRFLNGNNDIRRQEWSILHTYFWMERERLIAGGAPNVPLSDDDRQEVLKQANKAQYTSPEIYLKHKYGQRWIENKKFYQDQHENCKKLYDTAEGPQKVLHDFATVIWSEFVTLCDKKIAQARKAQTNVTAKQEPQRISRRQPNERNQRTENLMRGYHKTTYPVHTGKATHTRIPKPYYRVRGRPVWSSSGSSSDEKPTPPTDEDIKEQPTQRIPKRSNKSSEDRGQIESILRNFGEQRQGSEDIGVQAPQRIRRRGERAQQIV